MWIQNSNYIQTVGFANLCLDGKRVCGLFLVTRGTKRRSVLTVYKRDVGNGTAFVPYYVQA